MAKSQTEELEHAPAGRGSPEPVRLVDRRGVRAGAVAVAVLILLGTAFLLLGPGRGTRQDIAKQRRDVGAQRVITGDQLETIRAQLETTQAQLDVTRKQLEIAESQLATSQRALDLTDRQVKLSEETVRIQRELLQTIEIQRELLRIAQATLAEVRDMNSKIPRPPPTPKP